MNNQTARLIPALLILIVSAISIFGFFSMAIHGNDSCLFSVVIGGNCATIENALLALDHHVSGFRNATQATLQGNAMLTLLLLASALFLVASARGLLDTVSKLRSIFLTLRTDTIPNAPQEQVLRWLAIRTHEDDHALSRVHR